MFNKLWAKITGKRFYITQERFKYPGVYIIIDRETKYRVADVWHPRGPDVAKDIAKELCEKLNKGLITEESSELVPYQWWHELKGGVTK